MRERESEERRQQPLIAIDKKEKFKCLVDNFYNHYRCLSFIRTRNTHFCIFIINICLEFLCFAYSKFLNLLLSFSRINAFFRIAVNINCDVDWVEITPLTWFTLKFNRKNLISFQKLENFHSFLYITPQKKDEISVWSQSIFHCPSLHQPWFYHLWHSWILLFLFLIWAYIRTDNCHVCHLDIYASIFCPRAHLNQSMLLLIPCTDIFSI